MGIIGIIKGFITSVLVLLLMISVSLFIVTNSVKSTFLQPSFYSTKLDANVYLGIQTALVGMASNMLPQSQLSTLGITSDDVNQALSKQFTVEWVKNQTTRLSASLIGYVTGQTQTYDLTVSVKPQLMAALSDLASSKLSGLGLSQADMAQMISGLGNGIPDPYDISSLPGTQSSLESLKSDVTLFLTASTVVMVAIIVLLVLIFLLNMSLARFAMIIGVPMLMLGVLTAVGANLLPGTLSNTITNLFQSNGAGAQASTIAQTVVSIFQPLFSDIFVQSLILIILGVLLVIFAFVYPMVRKNKNKK